MPCQKTLALNFKEPWYQRAHYQHVFILPFFLREAYHPRGYEVLFTSVGFNHWQSSQLWEGTLENRAIALLDEIDKELVSLALSSIALNCIQRSSPNSPKDLFKTCIVYRNATASSSPNQIKALHGVVLTDRTEYIGHLTVALVYNTSKLIHIDDRQPKPRRWPPKYYHPLLQKEKELRQRHIKYCLRKLQIHSLQKAPSLHISPDFLRLTKPR